MKKEEEIDFSKSNAFITANDLVESMLLREEDFDKKNKALYLSLFKEVYQDLNLSIIRQTERIVLRVDKKTQSVYAPENYLDFSSIAVADHRGKFVPLIVNENIDTDIIDLGASTKCECEDCECDCSYCSNIRNYELISSIISAKMPDNSFQEFTATTRKKIFKDGSYVREITTPTEIFVNNVHTETILQTKTEHLCKLEVKSCGCIKSTKKNEELIYSFLDSDNIHFDCGCPVRMVPNDTKFYKISDKGNRIHFPFNFPYDTVLLRFYGSEKTKNIRIPYMAQKAVRYGIKAEQTDFQSPGIGLNQYWNNKYQKEKGNLLEKISRLKLSDFFKHIVGSYRVL